MLLGLSTLQLAISIGKVTRYAKTFICERTTNSQAICFNFLFSSFLDYSHVKLYLLAQELNQNSFPFFRVSYNTGRG